MRECSPQDVEKRYAQLKLFLILQLLDDQRTQFAYQMPGLSPYLLMKRLLPLQHVTRLQPPDAQLPDEFADAEPIELDFFLRFAQTRLPE
ncbi:hypothetical protein FACS18945_2830 [Bacteroidia bacterium]|nr:hypothetical protein FACS18945_2830 [Bacteroidia bacterium]